MIFLFLFKNNFLVLLMLGTQTHTLDKKGRVTVPSSNRKDLKLLTDLYNGKLTELLRTETDITRALDIEGYLHLSTENPYFISMDKNLGCLSVGSTALLYLSYLLDPSKILDAEYCPLDQDRINLSKLDDQYMNHAGIQDKVLFHGNGLNLELWNPDKFNEYRSRADIERVECEAGQIIDLLKPTCRLSRYTEGFSVTQRIPARETA